MSKKFNDFLTEATFSPNTVGRVVNLIVKMIEKKIGQKFYRLGGQNGFEEITVKNHPGKGQGFLFFTPNKLAIRFNFVKGEIVSLSFWRSWSINSPSDMYIDFGGANIVQIVSLVIEKIRHAMRSTIRPEIIPAYLPESVQLDGATIIEEAVDGDPRKDPHAFYAVMRSSYPDKDESFFRDMHWRDIANAGAMHTPAINTIPRFVKDQAVPNKKGFYNVVPGASAKVGEGEPILYIKVTQRDPVTNKFLSASESKAAQDMYKQIQGALTDNSAEMAKKEVKDPSTLFGALANLTKLVIKGTNKALLIYGGPGTGKSFTVTNELNGAGLMKNRDWYHIKGKVTTQALYQTMFLHRKGKIIVFDDADSVFNTEDSANILKAGLDSYDERFISWISPKTVNVALMDDQEREDFNTNLEAKILDDPTANVKFPSEFRYEGRIIFISNLPEKDIDTAVLSRAFKINMDLTDEQMFMRMEQIVMKVEPGIDLSDDERRDTLRVLKERNALGQLKNPQMRTLVAAMKIRASGVPDWLDLLQYS